MLPRNQPDRIRIAFDDHRLVANAGLIIPSTLALRLGLPQLLRKYLDLGNAPGRANTGDKMMTLVASALAGGDCIDAADVLRTGGTARALGGTVKAPSPPPPAFARAGSGYLLAQLPVGPCPSTGPGEPRVAGPGLAGWGGTRRLAPDHRPGLHHLRDLRTGQGGRPPPRLHRRPGLSPAAGRRRRHRRRANVPAARGLGQHRSGRRPLPAGNGEPGALRWGQRTTHGAGRQRLLYPRRGRRLPQAGPALLQHHPPPPKPAQSDRGHTRSCLDAGSLLDGRRRRCGRDTYTPFQTEADAAPVRRIVRRVRPTPGSQLALFATYSYHGFSTDRDGETLELEADHRRHAEIENAIRDLKYGVGLNHLPSGRCAANAAWLAVQVMAHNLARWTARIGLGEQIVTTKTLRRRVFALAGRLTRSARRLTLHLPRRWPWEEQFSRALARLRAIPLPA